MSMKDPVTPGIGGDTPLTRRLVADPYIRDKYNTWMQEYFLDSGSSNYKVNAIIEEVERIYDEIDRAVYYEPTYINDYQKFPEYKSLSAQFPANEA